MKDTLPPILASICIVVLGVGFVALLQAINSEFVWIVGLILLFPAIVAGWTGLAYFFDKMFRGR